MSETSEYILEIINLVTTCSLILDFLFQFIQKGVVEFFHCNIEKFMFLVIVISTTENIIQIVYGFERRDELPDLVRDVLEIFYCLRFLKLLRILFIWQELCKIFDILVDSLREILSFYFLMIVFIFMYSLLGMQLFSFKTYINR